MLRNASQRFCRCVEWASRLEHGFDLLLLWQEYEGELNFATDAWTSPNHKAFIAVTVHFETDGIPVSLLLDIVEVADSHSGARLAIEFAKILDNFEVSDKVSTSI
jgi:hypothetical protein